MCENKFQLVITNFQPDTPYEDFDLTSSSLSRQYIKINVAIDDDGVYVGGFGHFKSFLSYVQS